MSNHDKCHHCGAERIAHPLDKNHTILDCGSVEGWRTPLCREREEHNKTKEELTRRCLAMQDSLNLLAESQAENQKLRQEVEELTNQLNSIPNT